LVFRITLDMSTHRKSGRRYPTTSGLYVRVQEENCHYVADFFTKEGQFVATWPILKSARPKNLLQACGAYASLLCMGGDPGRPSF